MNKGVLQHINTYLHIGMKSPLPSIGDPCAPELTCTPHKRCLPKDSKDCKEASRSMFFDTDNTEPPVLFCTP
jgi:hypothetical protein